MQKAAANNLPERIEEYFNDWYVRYLLNAKASTIQLATPEYIFMGDRMEFKGYSKMIEELLNDIDKCLEEYQQSKYPDLFQKA